ncbi:MAG: MFS transporter [Microbacterium gubbeenense]|uniref:MFS transporter n=1 Tax=Microbacterium gubbeenense TaxID=159896 RepID=UPI003F988280
MSEIPRPPALANSEAVPVLGLQKQLGGAPTKKSTILSWALWDWGLQPFNTIIVTFIFTALYLTTDAFLPADVAAMANDHPAKKGALADLASGLGWGSTIAGLLILLLAPVLGQQADAQGRQKLWLGIGTIGTVLSMLALWFAEPAPAFFWFAVSMISAGTVLGEIAAVNSNALLVSIATPKNIGRISGLGWGFGYVGGVVALILVVAFYISDWFGIPDDGGVPFRLIAVGCAVWAIVFCLPVFLKVPEPAPLGKPERKAGFFQSYAILLRDVKGLYKNPTTRNTFWFLLSSAVFRDGLAGVFAFGAVIASQVFDFGFIDIVIFGIAANLIAGVSTMVAGRWDDRFGPKAIIVFALTGMVVAGLLVFFFADAGKIVFWIFGLVLCAFVGPAQSAGRSFLARVTPAGREGEIFGLYATTGRAASWMSAALWSAFIAITSATIFGVLGIVLVLLAGLLLILPVKPTTRA